MSRTVVTLTNPIYTRADKTGIDCKVKFAELDTTIDFHSTQEDPEPYGKQIYADLIAGKYGPIANYVEPPKSA